MTTAAIDARATAQAVARHMMSFLFPLMAFAFVVTGPHTWQVALWGIVPLVVFPILDSPRLRLGRSDGDTLAAWPFDAMLYVHAALHVVTLGLLFRLVAVGGFWTVDAIIAILLVSSNSGMTAIVVAHELIHRRERGKRLLGRLLLVTVGYEHFYTEHIRGHHVRVGTPEDPATARFGERFWPFFRRTVPGQFRSAWRLEAKRLGDIDMPCWDRRMLRSAVVHGLAAELALGALVLAAFGVGAFAAHVIQGLRAVLLLESVNYFEHWGLVREGARPATVDSWDTESQGTVYTLVGLAQHADHHAHPSRPFQALRDHEESPKLPCGYLRMVALVLFRNDKFRHLMTKELARKRLGPFRETAAAA